MMVCPVCTREIKPRDGVVRRGGYTVHGRCDGKPFVRQVAMAIDPRTTQSLVDLLVRMLQVPPMSGQTHTGWIAHRASNIAQVLIGSWGGWCPEHGALPLVELRDDETTEKVGMVVRR